MSFGSINDVRLILHEYQEVFYKLAYRIRRVPKVIAHIIDYTTDPQRMSVVPSLVLFYVLCFINGFYNTFFAVVPVQILEETLAPFNYNVFTWITLIAPTMTLVGMSFRGVWAWTGAWFQLTGNIGVSLVLWTFIGAVFETHWWGKGTFATTWVLASAIGAIVFVIRDIRRIYDKTRWAKVHG